MEIKEIEKALRDAGINKSVDELLALSEDELFTLLGELAVKEGTDTDEDEQT